MLFVNRILDSCTALMEVSECNLKELCCNKNPGCETSTHYLIVRMWNFGNKKVSWVYALGNPAKLHNWSRALNQNSTAHATRFKRQAATISNEIRKLKFSLSRL